MRINKNLIERNNEINGETETGRQRDRETERKEEAVIRRMRKKYIMIFVEYTIYS